MYPQKQPQIWCSMNIFPLKPKINILTKRFFILVPRFAHEQMFDLKMMCQIKCNTCAQGFNVGFEHYASFVCVVLIVFNMR